MKKFLIQVSLFAISVLSLLILIVIVTNRKIDNSPIFQLPKKINYLVLGHSHPEGAFNDSLINNSKNLSQSGELYFYTYLKSKKILNQNNQVKTIFLEFTNNEIINDMEKWTKSEEHILYRIPKYAPIMDKDDYQYIISKNPMAFIKAMPKVFKNNINTLVYKYNDYITINEWGKYFYNKRQFVDSILKVKKPKKSKNNNLGFNDTNLYYLTKIIQLCKEKKVAIYLVRSPMHKKEHVFLANESLFQETVKAKFSSVDFLDFKEFPLLNEDYGDLDHLNYKGAKKFSLFFNNLLENDLLKKKYKQEFINSEMKYNSK